MKIGSDVRRVVIGLLVLAILASTVWRIWLYEPVSTALEGVDTIKLSMRFLWDPTDSQLADWQLLGNPTDILLGPFGELLVSDGNQARVVRFTTNGDYIETIGRKGAGPGEFEACLDLGYCPADSTLWVVDARSGLGSVSRFRLSSTRSKYQDRFVAPIAWLQISPTLVVNDPHSFWAHHFSVPARRRILQINDHGDVINSFGEPFHPPDVTTDRPWMISSHSIGFPELVAPDTLIFVYMARPVIELWSTTGNLLAERELDSPEIQSITRRHEQSRKGKQNQDLTPTYFLNARWHERSSAVYIQTVDYMQRRQVIFAIEPARLEIVARYVVDADYEDHYLTGLAVTLTSSGLQFYMIDMRTAGIVLLEPVS